MDNVSNSVNSCPPLVFIVFSASSHPMTRANLYCAAPHSLVKQLRPLGRYLNRPDRRGSIYQHYASNQCPHGMNGNKLGNGLTCPHLHTRRCPRFCKFGTKRRIPLPNRRKLFLFSSKTMQKLSRLTIVLQRQLQIFSLEI